MTDFTIGAPFNVYERDVYPFTREFLADLPGPAKIARTFLAERLFGAEPHERLAIAVGIGEFDWINEFEVAPWGRGPTLCVWIAPDAALFAGWVASHHAPRSLMASDLEAPEAFRMKFRALIPTYSRRYQNDCLRRRRAREAAELG